LSQLPVILSSKQPRPLFTIADIRYANESRPIDSTGNGGARLARPHLRGAACGSEAAWAGEL